MGKEFGSDRLVDKYRQPHAEVARKVAGMKESGDYSIVEKTAAGGIFAIEKGKARHKPDEIEAGRHMAEAGYHVTLKDETGDVKTPDGHVFSFTYEQRTPTKAGGAHSVVKSIEHAKKKTADVAVIYDKHHVYNRTVIEQGIELYERHNKYRFKRVIIISKSGNVYEHSHKK